MLTHLGPPREETLRVPMVMVLPGSGQEEGESVEGLVGTVDIAPTLFSYLGLRVPRRFQGKDLLPLTRGEGRGGSGEAFAATEDNDGRWYALRTPGTFYSLGIPGGESLFDMAGEGEGKEVTEKLPERRGAMKKRLTAWIDGTPEVGRPGGEGVSAEVREVLRKGGYLEDAEQ